MNSREVSEKICGPDAEVGVVVCEKRSVGGESDSLVVLYKFELVVQVDQLEDGLDVMVAVGSLAEDMQSNIDLCVGSDVHQVMRLFWR